MSGGSSAIGDGGSSDQSSHQTTNNNLTTNNEDNRVAIQGGAQLGDGASINGMIINDSTATQHAMDVVGTSTESALVANLMASNAASEAATNAANAAAQASAASAAAAGAAGQAAANAAGLATSNMAGVSNASMNTVFNMAGTVAGVAQKSNADMRALSDLAMSGTWESANDVMRALVGGMDMVLSSSRDVLSMQSAASEQIGGQIDQAYSTAQDVSTGNRQLVLAGMAIIGLAAVMMLGKGKF